jgi:hypothetical protein
VDPERGRFRAELAEERERLQGQAAVGVFDPGAFDEVAAADASGGE